MIKRGKWVLSILALSLAVAGCSSKEANTSVEDEETVPVQVEQAVEGLIRDQGGIAGKFEPNTTAHLSPKVNGKLSKVHVKVGQVVSQGDTLFTLDQVDLQNAVKQAEASYQVALANVRQAENSSEQGLDQAQSNVTQLEQSLKQSQNGIEQAQQAYDDAQANATRMKQLYEAGAISTVEWENAQSSLKNAKLALDNAVTALENTKASYENAKNSVGFAQAKSAVDVARASAAQALSGLENAREQLANATVKAPISGIVSAVNGAAGEMVGPQGPVVTIVDINPIIVKAHLSESEVTTANVGDPVTIEIPALSKTLEASVTTISPVMDEQLKAFPMEISVPNGDHQWKADMIVDILFNTADKQRKSIVAPRKAVFDEQGTRWVYKVTEENIVEKIEVATGHETSSEIEIISGVQSGDTIVVKGQTLLSDGAKVEIQNQE
ncbi:efflux transporter periplasmic adaptor subunit [Ammoniphilus oxalaticus]|uniref:Efflux transporter periplasmic adaptor subunit n=1 Tax=Ammoniphilus oxalaticus TaxID=66863 RepID=A0A419SM31_9BACL|nr:efflux RND transporter periplasmic adaptor subunit [Ammoniphilus oxalaticus]RKD25127.1 efflux transporter periplasmic adaptor subunit [Ammoniphilus oxalaticus]